MIFEIFCALTALVPTALWRAVKKNGSTWRQITDACEEQKRLRCFVRTLLIKDFKYGSSLSLLTEKIIRRRTVKHHSNFTLTNNAAREFDSG